MKVILKGNLKFGNVILKLNITEVLNVILKGLKVRLKSQFKGYFEK